MSLTLDNFDAPGNRNKHYILTSPSSLRACARLGFKPIELLPKSFVEFKEQFHRNDMSHLQLLEIYMEFESLRKRKLLAAKKERCHLKRTELVFEGPKSEAACGADSKAQNTAKEQQILESVHTHLTQKLLQVKLDEQEQISKELRHKEQTINAVTRREKVMRKKTEDAKMRVQEERLRFEQSKHNKIISDIIEKEKVIQAIEKKHKSAEKRYDLLCARKENELRKLAELRLLRSQECKLTAHNLEVSLEKWRNEVEMRSIEARERAQQTVQQANEEKSTKLRHTHHKRVAAHVACKARLEREHHLQLENWERKIGHWTEKVDALTRQKTAEIDKSRALAHYSAMLRAKFKEYTSANSFADKSLHAEMYAALEKTH